MIMVMTAFMCSWPHPYSTLVILEVFPLHQIAHAGGSERMGLNKLFSREIIFEKFQPMWSRYLIVTDTRTDDMQSHHRALSWPSKSRSSKVTDVGANRKRASEFL